MASSKRAPKEPVHLLQETYGLQGSLLITMSATIFHGRPEEKATTAPDRANTR